MRELPNDVMVDRKICPIMSDSRGMILCQGKHCYAAYLKIVEGNADWFCALIDGPDPSLQKDRE